MPSTTESHYTSRTGTTRPTSQQGSCAVSYLLGRRGMAQWGLAWCTAQRSHSLRSRPQALHQALAAALAEQGTPHPHAYPHPPPITPGSVGAYSKKRRA
ncbi:hypothetical protein ABBQ38_006162 [Trebouxia sp. C0009 RCD-2024]